MRSIKNSLVGAREDPSDGADMVPNGTTRIELVCATRLSEKEFWETSALGISLRRLHHESRLSVHLTLENRAGLPELYNARILAQDSDEILVFVHDDVWIDDFFFADRVTEGLRKYDVIGVAGNRRIAPNQTSWAFLDAGFSWDEKNNLSGSIASGTSAFGTVSFFGPAPADCELLDGVFLAAKRSALRENHVLFDPQFDFHFYDMDFCRVARGRNLRLGTWPICLTHQSEGSFGSKRWHEMHRVYVEKWGE